MNNKQTGLLAPQNNFIQKISKRFKGTHANFVIGNASVPPNFPIVYCSDGFCELTGLSRSAVMKEPVICSFLHGPGTQKDKKDEIVQALADQRELKLTVQLYTHCGLPFWCLLDIIPIRNEFGKIVLILVSFKDISDTYSDARIFSSQSLDSRMDSESLQTISEKMSSRRRSRAVLNDLSGCYSNQNSAGKMSRNKTYKSHLSTISAPIYRTAKHQNRFGIISHYGSFRKCWDFVILVAIMYVALIVPYNAAFNRNPNGECNRTNLKPSIACDILVEMIFILDIIFNFRMTFVNKKGEVVFTPKEIASNYVSGWFILDLLAALPFDLLYATCSIQNMDNFTSVDILKLTRLVRLARFIQKMDRLSQYSAVILSMLMVCFGFIAHWLACLWFVIGVHFSYNSTAGWMEQLAELNHLENITMIPKTDAYITALYFTCTSLTTVGFGNVAGNTRMEKIFCIFVMFVGALMHATIFGNVASIVARLYTRRQEYDKKMLDLDHFAHIHKLPKDIRLRMKDHLQTKWFFYNGIDYEVTEEYPNCLRGEISAHIHREILDLHVFDPLPDAAKKKLGQIIETDFAGPTEYLINKDDILSCVWYVSTGSLEVLDKGMVVAILGSGDLFGSDLDHLLLRRDILVQSEFDVKALTYCELKRMDTEMMISCMDILRGSSLLSEVCEALRNDLTYNLRGNTGIIVKKFHKDFVLLKDSQTQTEKEMEPQDTGWMEDDIDVSGEKEADRLIVDSDTVNSYNLSPRPSITQPRVTFDLDPAVDHDSESSSDRVPLKRILRRGPPSRSSSLDPGFSRSSSMDPGFSRNFLHVSNHRSASLREDEETDFSSTQLLVEQEENRKYKEMSPLQKFQARFSKRNVCLDEGEEEDWNINQEKDEDHKEYSHSLVIPEIKLDVPEEEKALVPQKDSVTISTHILEDAAGNPTDSFQNTAAPPHNSFQDTAVPHHSFRDTAVDENWVESRAPVIR